MKILIKILLAVHVILFTHFTAPACLATEEVSIPPATGEVKLIETPAATEEVKADIKAAPPATDVEATKETRISPSRIKSKMKPLKKKDVEALKKKLKAKGTDEITLKSRADDTDEIFADDYITESEEVLFDDETDETELTSEVELTGENAILRPTEFKKKYIAARLVPHKRKKSDATGETEILSGEDIFIRHCDACHGGENASFCPSLKGERFWTGFSDEKITKLIRRGDRNDKADMPAFPPERLSEKETRALIDYLKKLPQPVSY